MNPILDLPPLATSLLALSFILRARNRSYFFDTGFFMIVANVGFIILIVQNLVSDVTNLPPSGILVFSLISLMAFSIGLASYLVPNRRNDSAGKKIILTPQFLAYTVFLASWSIVTIILSPWRIIQTETSQGPAYYYNYETWFMVLSSILLILFIALPVRSFFNKTFLVADQEAARSIKIIGVSWAFFGISTFLQTYLAQYSILTVQTGASLLNSGLFLLIALALKEPTVLGRIITTREFISSPGSRLESRSSGTTIPAFRENFSMRLEMKHEKLEGNRILLEYEPTASYEMLVQDFMEEFKTHGDSVAVFTSVGSPIYRLALDQSELRIFGFSTKTSNPAKISEQTVLLPERDASLLLDALDKLVKAYSSSPVAIVFDVFTDMILSQGFEKVYSPLSSVVELAESPNITTMFLINEAAMENHALNGIRGLFRFQLRYDTVGLEKIVDSAAKHEETFRRGNQPELLEKNSERQVEI
jgi:uncharacterized membrane protein YidH (DUF202 family)